ncbi:protein of unknown function [Clostridium cavendishii DSM 21758]|uniref:Beta-lactamase inhibitor (BLIP) n=1 Tax=Clostridium cavendishii DSM 21758 TaxID=1121302 RepID=A0A1M6SUF4_9CLOT|nr:DUF3862 domain-containing protein [Clostridium cavendishii]SHK48325.1 protein of unknown function [Clostridium cavendishii DSM 21758]
MKKLIISLMLVCSISTFIGCGGTASKKDTSSSNETKKEDIKKEDTKVTYENFLKISMGQSYDDVKAILGEGKETSSSEVGGIKTVMYTWNGNGISNMNITIQNNVVTGKAQVGLTKNNSDITLEKYNQVKEGMTYDQVKAIIGEGQVTSHTKIATVESIMYSYINKTGANANFTFNKGKLQLKAQFNLK